MSLPLDRPARRLPEVIDVECYLDANAVSGAWATLTIETFRKNSFAVSVGPSSEKGLIHTVRDELLSEALQELNAFPADYSHPERDWTGRIGVRMLNVDDVTRALRAYEMFSGMLHEYPPGYSESLSDYRDLLLEWGPGRALVALARAPDDAQVVFSQKVQQTW